MDVDISRWIFEFLIRQPVPDELISVALKVLPLSHNDSRLKKTILLRSIQSEIANASASEKVMETLEIIEELDHSNGTVIMESMRAAYCAVAVECTVKYLDCTEDKFKYLDAVNRIWRGKICKMEESGKSELVSVELKNWREDIEAAVWDVNVCNNLLEKNTRNDALRMVRAYLGEAWAFMGPTFLEMVARTLGNREIHTLGDNRFQISWPSRELRVGANLNLAAGLTTQPKVSASDSRGIQCKVGERVADSPNASLGDRLELGAGGVLNETQVLGLGDKGVGGKVVIREADLLSEDQGLVDSDRPVLKDIGRDVGVGVGLSLTAATITQPAVLGSVSSSKCDKVGERATCLPNARFSDGGEELPRSGAKPADDKVEETETRFHSGQNLVGSDRLPMGDKETEKVNIPLKRKQVPCGTRSRGDVKISDSKHLDADKSCSKYVSLLTPEVNKVREALKSSSLELQAVVMDPLPDALRVAKTIVSDMARNTNHEPSVENHASTGVEMHAPSVIDKVDSVQANEAKLGNQSFSHPNNVPRPSLMERNSTARTYEWSNSADNSPEKRPHIPSPKRRIVSPLKKPVITRLSKRRVKKKWSLLEEDTLRTGVQKYGRGNWKFILNCYRDVFEERTEVDLKDKWRNMTRY